MCYLIARATHADNDHKIVISGYYLLFKGACVARECYLKLL